ncbi:MAG: glycosyltransferase family 10 [Bacteroidota bacterium]
MKKLKLNFSDFDPYNQFSKQENYFTRLLSKQYEVEISENPDLLFYSNYGKDFQKYQCTRIFFTVENLRPNYHECDYAFSFDLDPSEKHFRFPSYCFYGNPYPYYGDPENLTKPKDPEQIISQKKKFCCFIVSNPFNKIRNTFFHELSKYKQVDSGGRFLNNLGHVVSNKSDFLKEYKFAITFENESYPGYTTEKIFEAMQVNTIPVYWGNPFISSEFNTRSFINCHDLPDFKQAVDQIIRIDNDDALYARYLNEPYFIENKVPQPIREDTVLRKLISIIENNNHIPVGITEKNYSYIRNFADLLTKPISYFLPLSVKKTYFPQYRKLLMIIRSFGNTSWSAWRKFLKLIH